MIMLKEYNMLLIYYDYPDSLESGIINDIKCSLNQNELDSRMIKRI